MDNIVDNHWPRDYTVAMRYSSEKKKDCHLAVNNCGEFFMTVGERNVTRQKGRVDYGIFYVRKESFFYFDGDLLREAKEGELVLFFPGVPRCYEFDGKKESVVLWANFTGEATVQLDLLKCPHPLCLKITEQAEFERVFLQMITAHHRRGAYCEEISAGFLQVLLAMLLKSNQAGESALRASRREDLDRVLEYMSDHCHEPIDLQHYADMCYVSSNRFINIFKNYTGVSPYHFQLQLRMERAIELLLHSSATVGECAAAVGFKDSAYFSRIFKKMTGYPPSYFKK